MKVDEGAKTAMNKSEEPRPNREAYSAMFHEDNPDIDFEDKEARYGRMAKEREQYRQYRDSGKKLSEVFEKNPWTAKMLMDLKDNPDLNPITWMADNGIDIADALSDEKYAKEVADHIATYQAQQLKNKQVAAERDDNLHQSARDLQKLEKEYNLTDEQCGQIWADFFENVLDPALRGIITTDTWAMVIKARNYDNDIQSARNEGAMNARNEKILNNLRQRNEGETLPPTLGQDVRGKSTPKPKEEGFFDDLKE